MVFEVSAASLLGLLVAREMLEFAGSPRVRRLSNLLYVPVVPLLGLFIVTAIARLAQI